MKHKYECRRQHKTHLITEEKTHSSDKHAVQIRKACTHTRFVFELHEWKERGRRRDERNGRETNETWNKSLWVVVCSFHIPFHALHWWLQPHPSSTQFDISKKRWRMNEREWNGKDGEWRHTSGKREKKTQWNYFLERNISGSQRKIIIYTCYKHSLHLPPIAYKFR